MIKWFSATIIALLATLALAMSAQADFLANPTITSQPATKSQTSTISWTVGPGETTECSVDGGGFFPCQSPYTADLADGLHSIALRARSGELGQSAIVTLSFVLDRLAPEPPTIVDGPAPITIKTSADFNFIGEGDASFECKLDDGDPFFCFAPESFEDLEDGNHTFTVSQTDPAGNKSAEAIYNWTIGAEGEDGEESDHQADLEIESSVSANASSDGKGTSIETACVLKGELIIEECTIELWAARSLLGKDADVALAPKKLIKIGEGTAGPSASDPKRAEATIRLNKWGRLMVERNIGGFAIEVRMDLLPAGGTNIVITKPSFITTRRQVIAPADSLFPFASSTLSARGQKIINKVARALPRRVQLIVCVGHTDNRGSRSYNRWLGQRRAEAVCSRIRQAGVKGRFRSKSLGESRPRVSNRTSRGRAQNRRVEIRVIYRKPKA